MANIYKTIEAYYDDSEDTAYLLPQSAAEQYFRKKAWKGATEEELAKDWELLTIAFDYAAEFDLFSFSEFIPVALAELVFRYFDDHPDAPRTEQEVLLLLQRFEAMFCHACAAAPMELSTVKGMFRAARELYYERGRFRMPERLDPYEDFELMEDDDAFDWQDDFEDEEEEEELDPGDLDDAIHELLTSLQEYYRAPKWQPDIQRAMYLYFGPARMRGDFGEEPPGEQELQMFWDFFLFDYHLLESDKLPIQEFCYEKDSLPRKVRDIAEKLLTSRFALFYVETMDSEYSLCRDLFTGEEMELPRPDVCLKEARKVLFFGHVHADGVMLLNYIGSVSATAALRRRIKEEIERLYAIYRIQAPEATLEDFFARHAAAVRHLVLHMTTYAQLRIVPEIAPVAYTPTPEPPVCVVAEAKLARALRYIPPFSSYERKAFLRLFADASAGMETPKASENAFVAAVALYFAIQNVKDIGDVERFFKGFHTTQADVAEHLTHLFITMGMLHPDPRYLTELGFVHLLFTMPEQKEPLGTDGPRPVKSEKRKKKEDGFHGEE